MALTPTEEAQTRQLIAQQAPLLSLAGNEATITSKLGATKVNLSQLPAATTPADADLLLIRQGTTDKSIAASLIKTYAGSPDATSTVKGVVTLAVAAEYPSVSDVEVTTPAYVNSALTGVQVAAVGSFSNLKSSATGLSALITVTADELVVENTSNAYRTLRAVSVTPSLATSGANGLDTGTSAASTWYSVWVIWNGTTTAGLLSLSATAPTMPSGYTHKARVGWVRSDGTANKYPLSFVQTGRTIQYKVAASSNVAALPIMASGVNGSHTTPTWVPISTSTFIPSTAGKIKIVVTNVNSGVIVAPNNSYGSYTSTTNPPPVASVGAAVNSSNSAEFTLESSNIYVGASVAGTIVLCFGWEDSI